MNPEFVAMAPWGQVYRVDAIEEALGQPIEAYLHPASQCEGHHCPIHNPSDHPLKDAPMTLRLDKSAIIERQCPHGIGHSDPDSIAWLVSVTDKDHARALAVHGCDGCCMTTEAKHQAEDEEMYDEQSQFGNDGGAY